MACFITYIGIIIKNTKNYYYISEIQCIMEIAENSISQTGKSWKWNQQPEGNFALVT